MAQLVGELGYPANAAATVSGSTSATTRTITCPPGSRIKLRSIFLYASASSNLTLTVTVGAVVVADFGTLALTTASTNLVDINIVGPIGSNFVINVGAGSAGTTTITHSAEVF